MIFLTLLTGNIYDEPSLPDPIYQEVEVNMDMKRNKAYCQVVHIDNTNWLKEANTSCTLKCDALNFQNPSK